MFDLQKNADGTVNILNVPIFRTHQDRRYNCDEAWLDRCVADFMGQKLESLELAGGDAKYAMLPSLTVGHTPEDPNAPEPHCEGFLDNIRRSGKLLYADLMNVSRDAWTRIKAGKLPYRSAEVIPSKHRITNLSLLGGRYPHFALPVMRFRSKAHGEVLRYTFTTEPRTPVMDPNELLQLAQTLAPMVADLMSGKQAEAAENDMTAAGDADDDLATSAGEQSPDGDMTEHQPDQFRSVDRVDRFGRVPTPARVAADAWLRKHDRATDNRRDRHREGTVSATGQRSGAFETNEHKPNTGANEAPMSGSELGDTNPAKSEDKNIKQAYRALENEVKALRGELQQSRAQMGELQRHKIAEAQAAKRAIIRSKCKEIAALYAIGDLQQIERHVDRMMPLAADEVKAYFEDVLKQYPKFGAAPQQRYGSNDVVRRPGADADENERYAAENADSMKRLGLNADILGLADVLAG